jgi:hypothetical protein
MHNLDVIEGPQLKDQALVYISKLDFDEVPFISTTKEGPISSP